MVINLFVLFHLVLSSPSDRICPDGFYDWMHDENSTWDYCYMQEHHDDITWVQAKENCTNKGGSLIVIHDGSLMDAIAVAPNLIPVPSWLGMTNNKPTGNIFFLLLFT